MIFFSDPIGWLEVKKTGHQYNNLPYTGDMIGTFMAWLSDTEAGGDTIYCQPGHSLLDNAPNYLVGCVMQKAKENL